MISVIIPSYNREKTLLKAANSVLNQTYKDIELIIVDDASSDNTESIVKKIKDSRVRYIKLKKNSGACTARNIGVMAAQGEYVAFQDSDDEWHKDKLQKQYDFTVNHKLDFSFCGMNRIMLENSNKRYYYPNVDIDNNKSFFLQLLFLNRVGTQTILCKRTCFEKIKFDTKLKRFQDWDFALQAARIYSIGYLRESLVDSFVQSDSISKNLTANKNAWKDLYKKYEKEIKLNPTIYAKYLFRLGNEEALTDINKAKDYYKKSVKVNMSITTLVFFILSAFKLKCAIKYLLEYQKKRLFK